MSEEKKFHDFIISSSQKFFWILKPEQNRELLTNVNWCSTAGYVAPEQHT